MWEYIRKTAVNDQGYVNPILIKDINIRDTYVGALNIQKNAMVTTADTGTFATVTAGGKQRGTAAREGSSTLLQYLSPALHQGEVFAGRLMRNKGSNLKDKSQLVVTLTLLGAFNGAWVNEIRGLFYGEEFNNPFDMNGEQFQQYVVDAMIRSGAYGIYGDFWVEAALGDGYTKGLISSPVLDTGANFLDTVKSIGDWDKFKLKGVKSILSLIPGQNLFYTKTIYERLFEEQILQLVDKGAARRRFKRQRDLADDKRDNKFWWKPGSALPDFLK